MSDATTIFAKRLKDDAAGNRLRIAHFLLWLAAGWLGLAKHDPADATIEADREPFELFGGRRAT
jgi:hypothetical protein